MTLCISSNKINALLSVFTESRSEKIALHVIDLINNELLKANKPLLKINSKNGTFSSYHKNKSVTN